MTRKYKCDDSNGMSISVEVFLMRERNGRCGPAVDWLGCRMSIKMASQPFGGTIPNKPTQ